MNSSPFACSSDSPRSGHVGPKGAPMSARAILHACFRSCAISTASKDNSTKRARNLVCDTPGSLVGSSSNLAFDMFNLSAGRPVFYAQPDRTSKHLSNTLVFGRLGRSSGAPTLCLSEPLARPQFDGPDRDLRIGGGVCDEFPSQRIGPLRLRWRRRLYRRNLFRAIFSRCLRSGKRHHRQTQLSYL